jgi:F0F1-type ATP synthase membrane subunit b/b'
LFIFVSIFVLIFILNRTLFKPINRVLDERERLGVGRLAEAQRTLARYEEQLSRYEEQIRAERAAAYQQLESERRAALAARQAKIAEAKNEVAGQIAAAQQAIAKQAESAKSNLEKESRAMAATISSHILHRPVSLRGELIRMNYLLFLLLAGEGVPAWIPKTVHLIILIGVLYYLLRKPAREFFAQRLASVREMLERAAREKEAAGAKMAELDARLKRLGDELAQIRTQAQQEAAGERQRIEAETQRDLEKLRLAAQREIEASKQVAIAELREFAATKAVELAEQAIKRELTPEDDARLLQRLGDELSRAS